MATPHVTKPPIIHVFVMTALKGMEQVVKVGDVGEERGGEERGGEEEKRRKRKKDNFMEESGVMRRSQGAGDRI